MVVVFSFRDPLQVILFLRCWATDILAAERIQAILAGWRERLVARVVDGAHRELLSVVRLHQIILDRRPLLVSDVWSLLLALDIELLRSLERIPLGE